MPKPTRVASLSLAVCLSSLASLAAVPASADTAAPGDRLRYDISHDIPITIAAGSIWLGTELLKPALAPPSCRWCDRSSDGTDALNGLDKAARDAFRWSSPRTAATISDVLGYGISPAAALGFTALAGGLEGRLREAPVNGLLILEASFASATLTQLAKFAFGRERPFVHALSPEDKRKTSQPSDNNLSFFSGHTNFAFALAVSSGTIAQIRGYRYAPLVWATGLPIAATIGYLRIAADKHYLTDVVTGAIVGTAAGFAIPFLFHRGEPAASSTAAIEKSAETTGSFEKTRERGARQPPRRTRATFTPSQVSVSPTNFAISWLW